MLLIVLVHIFIAIYLTHKNNKTKLQITIRDNNGKHYNMIIISYKGRIV